MTRLLLAAATAGAVVALAGPPAANAQYCTKCKIEEIKSSVRQCFATPDVIFCIP